jgi:pyruvate kinase
MKRKTKILATIGPASENPKTLEALFNAGANAFRLNLSHDVHPVHEKRIKLIRALSKKYNRPVAIIADLQGPKMRVGNLPKEGIELHSDKEYILDTNISDYVGGNVIPLSSLAFQMGVRAGNTVFLDDGSLMLKVKSVKEGRFVTEVLRGGTLYSRKGVNVPDLALRTEIFEKKDRDDMAFALRMNVDYLALSFIRNADDIKLARKLAGKSSVKLIAKIERHEALTAIDEIIAETDAIMIARGDLGIETPIWQLPKRQKEIIEKVRNAMKPVIVATQMLESMTKNAIPTRAEVSDVANAV